MKRRRFNMAGKIENLFTSWHKLLPAAIITGIVMAVLVMNADWLRPGTGTKNAPTEETQTVSMTANSDDGHLLTEGQRSTIQAEIIRLGGNGTEQDIRTVEVAVKDLLDLQDGDTVTFDGIQSLYPEGDLLTTRLKVSSGSRSAALKLYMDGKTLVAEEFHGDMDEGRLKK